MFIDPATGQLRMYEDDLSSSNPPVLSLVPVTRNASGRITSIQVDQNIGGLVLRTIYSFEWTGDIIASVQKQVQLL